MSEIEKSRDGIFQRLLVAQGPMSRSVVKSIMRDVDELCLLNCEEFGRNMAKALKLELPHQPDCAVAVNGRHECSCRKEITDV